jgi:hypothetical protein
MRHLNPLFNYIFSKVRDDLAYESEVDTNDFAYGNWWTKA